MTGRFPALLAACVLAAAPALALGADPAAADAARPRLSVLFLGDRGHHRPADRAAQLTPALALRGVSVAYTEDMGALSPENLSKYDALILYANAETIAPERERALLDYVRGGGGFVPLHCASYCFLNSPEYVKLVGAQFQRHGMGEVVTEVLDPSHPTMAGLEPFKTRDETYVHTRHNEAGRHVLQVRPEGDGKEPWTWARDEGKGRVFYTAYGHDGVTWGNPRFVDLVERGVRWAAGKGGVSDGRPRVAAGLPPFTYKDAGDNIPQYTPGAQWGAQGEPSRRMQEPATPAESAKHLALPIGFEAKLFAAEPLVAKPIAMAWDHLGRLWLAETRDYPNERQPAGKGRDKIVVCEDKDGDGAADSVTTFAEGLSIPTAMLFADGGLIVHQAPDTLFLKDSDGDGRADVRKVLFTGWGTSDTHAGPSNLRYGFDNWVYGIVGYAGFRGTVGGERHEFKQGFYRFRPDGSKLEFLRSTNNNSWGVGLSEEGLVFGSTANGCPSVFLTLANRYYESVRGGAPRVLRSIADSNRFFPVTDKVRQVDFHGGFTAAAGHALYTARAYPPAYWNRTAFVAEPTGHIVATFALEEKGTDFAAHTVDNLVASDDEWTSPVAAEVGPDGQVWVIDWYNYIVQHNPTPQGFATGKGAAYETPLRDKTHGRVYRIVHKDSPARHALKSLDPGDPAALLAGLKSDNLFWRLHAQRLLVERGKRDVVPALTAMVNDPAVDAIGLNPSAIHALWTLHGLGALDVPADVGGIGAGKAVAAALRHPSAGVRRNAIQVLPRDSATARLLAEAGSLRDADMQVRLAAWLALAESPPSAEAGAAIAGAIGSLGGDRGLIDAAVSASAAHDAEFLRAVASTPSADDSAAEVVRRAAEHYARGGPTDPIGPMLASLTQAPPVVAGAVVAGLAAGWPKGKPADLGADGDKALAALLGRLPAGSRVPLVRLAGLWGSDALDRETAALAESLIAAVRDESKPDEARAEAARQLVEFRPRDDGAARQILEVVTPRVGPGLALALVAAASQGDSPVLGKLLADRLPRLGPAPRAEAVRALLARADRTDALVDAVDRGVLPLGDLTLDQKQALAAHPNPAIAARAKGILSRGGGLPDADRQKVIDALSPVALKGGDPARGQAVYREQCAKCHAHGGEGGKVGPDLTGMAVHPREELLVHILDPSRSVEGNFLQYSLATTDGRVINGLLASESKTSVELLDAEGKAQTVARADIDELSASKKSLMPEGFEKQITPSGFADLLAFLTRRGKYLPLDLRKAATAVSTQGMFGDHASTPERMIFPDWSPKTFEGVPFHLVDPQGTRVANLVMLYGPRGTFPPTMPKAVSLACRTPVKAIHMLSGVSGWGATDSDAPYPVSMTVRVHYSDGATEDHPLRDGVEFADYIRRIDVPGSKFAFPLAGGRQIRYLAVRPARPDSVQSIELVKGPDDTAPMVMAVTVETPE